MTLLRSCGEVFQPQPPTVWGVQTCGVGGYRCPKCEKPGPHIEYRRACMSAEKTIRLIYQLDGDLMCGVEHVRDYASVTEASESVPADAVDWVIIERRPMRDGGMRVIVANGQLVGGISCGL